MARFSYVGRKKGGERVTGAVGADDAAAAARSLQAQGIVPVSIAEIAAEGSGAGGLAARLRKRRGRPGLDDLMFFCRQMHTLLGAGVPLIRGLSGLADTAANVALARTLRAVIQDLEGGYSLSQAFSQHGHIFPPLFVSVLQVGESSGRVDEAFMQLSGYLERERNTRAQMRAAVRYPAMVLAAIAAAMSVINLFVIPAFAKVFAGLKAELPLATRILLATSDFSVRYWPWLLVAAAGIALAVRGYVRTKQGRRFWDRFKLRLPVVGTILANAALARFTRSFAMTMRSGVPIVQAFTLLAGAVDNVYLGALLLEMRRSVERGDSIAGAAQGFGLFPPLVLQMIEVGEESGRLDQMLEQSADYYDREVEVDLNDLGVAIEPLLLLVVGGMVLVLALGVFLPMWDLGQAAMRR